MDERFEAVETRYQGDLYRLLVESVKDYAIFSLDRHGYILTWNEGAQRIKGYSADEIIGKHFSIFYPPSDARHGKPEYALRIAADEGCWEEEGWRIRKDGSRFWASVVITALHDSEGSIVGFAKVTRDLSERQRAQEEQTRLFELERSARAEAESALERLRAIESVTEAALSELSLDRLLRELLQRISDLLNVNTAAILLLSDDGQFLIPRAAKGIEEEVEEGVHVPLGHGFAGRIARERQLIVLDDAEHAAGLDPVLREKKVRSLMGVPLLIEGREIGVLHVGTLYARHFGDDDIKFLQIVADRAALAIEHARLYEAARSARQEADVATETRRLLNDFLSVAAHELKTPITSLRGFSELLLRLSDQGKQPDPQRLEQAIKVIVQQSDKLGRLVNQLLDASRLEGGWLTLDFQRADLADLLIEVVGQVQAQTTQHQIVLHAPKNIVVRIDSLRIEQVISNLLDNAIKFSPAGGQIDVDLTRPTPELLYVSVRDHGIGIPSDRRPRVFERFYQATDPSRRSGLGLGLHISEQIVARHGGQLWVESPADGGSRFIMMLPANGQITALEPPAG